MKSATVDLEPTSFSSPSFVILVYLLLSLFIDLCFS
jgi:hypothetical protein